MVSTVAQVAGALLAVSAVAITGVPTISRVAGVARITRIPAVPRLGTIAVSRCVPTPWDGVLVHVGAVISTNIGVVALTVVGRVIAAGSVGPVEEVGLRDIRAVVISARASSRRPDTLDGGQ